MLCMQLVEPDHTHPSLKALLKLLTTKQAHPKTKVEYAPKLT